MEARRKKSGNESIEQIFRTSFKIAKEIQMKVDSIQELPTE